MMRSKTLHIGLQFFATPRLAEIEARLSAIRTEMEADGADLDALETEVNDLTEERNRLTDAAERRSRMLAAIGEGSTGTETRRFPEQTPPAATAYSVDSEEYRSAYLHMLQGTEMTHVEQRAWTSVTESAGPAIPTHTANLIIEKATQYAPLLARITLLHVPGGVSFAVEGTIQDAKKHSENADIEADADVLGAPITLFAYEVTKLIRISKTVKNMAIPAFEAWLSDTLGKKIAKDLTRQILFGTGSEEGTGIDSITWNADNSVTTAVVTTTNVMTLAGLLPGDYDAGASWLMSKKTLFQDFLPLQDKSKNDLVKLVGDTWHILGYPVDLDERIPLHGAYLGDLAQVYGNLPEDITITGEFSLGKNAFQFLGCAMFDCKPAAKDAFVKLIYNAG